jgi:hypothetical protein
MVHAFGCLLVGKSSLILNISSYFAGTKSFDNFLNVYNYSLLIGVTLLLGTDMPIQNQMEKIFIVFVNVFSLAITANIFGYVALLIDILSYSQVRAHRERLTLINEYMHYEEVKNTYRLKINSFYNFMYARQRMMFMDNQLYEGLNNTLLAEIKFEMWKNFYFLKDKLFMMDVISPSFFGNALEYMEGKIYFKGDVIFEEGESSTDFYFVCLGSKCNVFCCGVLMNKLSQGDYFGETSIFTSSNKRTATVVSENTGDYLMIPGEMFKKLLMDFSNERNYFLNLAYKFIEFYDQIITPKKFGLFITKRNEVFPYILHKNLFVKPKTKKNYLWYTRKLYDDEDREDD